MIDPVQMEYEHPLRPIVEQWLRKIKDAQKVKFDKFGRFAREAEKFYDGDHTWMWDADYARGQGAGATGGFLDKEAGVLPMFRMTVNRAFEAVALFGPALYHRNPKVMVTPLERAQVGPEALGVDLNDQQMAVQYQQMLLGEQAQKNVRLTQAGVLQHYANWLQQESDKKKQARRSISEAIVKGMSLLWVEMFRPRGSRISYPRSTYVSVDDIVIDPDAEYWEDVEWIARRHAAAPVFRVEEEYDIPAGALKGHMESYRSQGETYANKKETSQRKRSGKSFDLMEYWEVFSRAGFGDKLRKSDPRLRGMENKFDFSMFGDFCYFVAAHEVPYPLNMPSWVLDEDPQDLFMRAQWPIPFWTDEINPWPFAELYFHEKSREIWPINLFKPVIGLMRFVNWCMSFLADKVAAASHTYVGVMKAAGKDIQDQIRTGRGPYTVVEISELYGKSIKEVVSFLDAPDFNVAIWQMVSEAMELIDKGTGLTELVYGLTGRQLRSAAEADIKEGNTSIRPDDMASQVEDWLSLCASKEVQAARWFLSGQDVAPAIGEVGALIWDQQIRTADVDQIVRDFQFRIEAGSARKPNKNNRIRSLNELGQIIVPTIQQLAMGGMFEPWNAYVAEVGKAMEIDVSGFLIQPPPQEEQGPTPEEMEIQMKQLEMEIKKAELQMKQEMHEADLEAKRKENREEFSHEKAMNRLEIGHEEKMMELDVKKKKQEAKAKATASNGSGK